jgi:hypothetical protein
MDTHKTIINTSRRRKMSRKYFPFYNLDEAVGPKAPNRQADVMLVQFFLRELAQDQSIAPMTRPKTPIMVDGVYGPVLGQWILWFQNAMNAKFKGNTLADGRVDPARGSYLNKSSISRTQYTIVSLNSSYRFRYKKSHDALENDSKVPSMLRAKFTEDDYV